MSSLLRLSPNRAQHFTLFKHTKSYTCLMRFQSTKPANEEPNQSQTQPKPLSNQSKYKGLKVFLVTLAGFGIGFAFTSYSSDMRKQIETSVPYSTNVFEFGDSMYEKLIKQMIALKNDSTKQEPLVKRLPEANQVYKSELKPIIEPSGEKTKAPDDGTKTLAKTVANEPALADVHKPDNNKKDTDAAKIETKTDAPKTIPSKPHPKPDGEKKAPVVVETKPVASIVERQTVSVQVQTDEKRDDDGLKSTQIETTSDWKETVREHDLREEAQIKAVEKNLVDNLNDLKKRVNDVKDNCKQSVQSLNSYRDALKLALNEEDEGSVESKWRTVTDLFEMQQHDVKQANEKISIAKKSLDTLDGLLVELKTKGFGKHIKNLRDIQLELIKQFKDFQYEKSRHSEAIANANVLRSYTNEQRLARTQFIKEMQALQPEGITGYDSEQMTVEQLNSLIMHAHKRVFQLQNQINRMQANETQRIQAALDEQKLLIDKIQADNIQSYLNVAKSEFELEKDAIAANVKLALYDDLKKELSRQAAAHNLHLAQMLKQQEDELELLYEKRLLIDAENIRLSHHRKVADSFGRLKGIEQALLARANIEFQAENAKKLWIAVQNLNELITKKSNNLERLENIKSTIELIRQSAPNNQFISTILSTLNETLVERGVWTEPDLKQRYENVDNICRKLALIDERGAPLVKYFISYVQSFFIFSTINKHKKLTDDLCLDAESLKDTFVILDLAKAYLDQNNFEMAIRLLNRLSGEPKRLASEWINEAIHLVEIKNACDLMNAYISSVYISSNFTN